MTRDEKISFGAIAVVTILNAYYIRKTHNRLKWLWGAVECHHKIIDDTIVTQIVDETFDEMMEHYNE